MGNKIYFIGAGPGDPELLTLKAHRLISNADIIIWAGSLVPKEVLGCAKEAAEIHDSASMDLQDIIAVMEKGLSNNKNVVRVHTGDPAIYGSIREQIEELKKLDISYEVVPGVSSFTAAAAAICKEFTVPEISQTVICTRMEGRTPVPELEKIELLASHQTSMAIFLSVHMISDLVDKLRTHYPADTPVAIIQRASWPDQKVVKATLETIADEVKKADITKTAMILVGRFLGDDYNNSLLYDAGFSHEYRNAKK